MRHELHMTNYIATVFILFDSVLATLTGATNCSDITATFNNMRTSALLLLNYLSVMNIYVKMYIMLMEMVCVLYCINKMHSS